MHKIRLSKVPKHVPTHILKEYILEKLPEGKSFTLKRKDKGTFAYLYFQTKDDLEQAIVMLNEFSIKGRKIKVNIDYSVCPEKQKRRLMGPESILDQVTPLWKLNYNEQLEFKEKHARQLMKKFEKQIISIYDSSENGTISINDMMDMSLAIQNIQNIQPSPIIDGYRNKCEFAIGYDQHGQIKIGFTLGAYVDDITEVGDPIQCKHVNSISKNIVKYIESWIINPEICTSYPPFSRKLSKGFWKLMTIRTFQQDMLAMVLFQVHSSENVNDNPKQYFEWIKEQLTQHCNKFDRDGWRIASVQIQISGKKSFGMDYEAPMELLSGNVRLQEILCGCRFSVSSSSFFQVNTECTQIMYEIVQNLALYGGKLEKTKIYRNLHLLDLCCGVGTIGICLGKSGLFQSVTGVEVISQAIEDAKLNCEMNSDMNNVIFNNYKWICGRIEQDGLLAQLTHSIITDNHSDQELIVILDPPRAGVHNDVVRSIRSNKYIHRVVYISCSPESAINNFIGLCRPTSKKYPGSAFHITKIIPIDMFPHTEHYELLLCFERSISE